MKYNNSYKGEDFAKYIEYLETIKHKCSESLYSFISDINRYGFEKQSLHDSWLKEIKLGTNFEKRFSSIKLILLGAYHDREFHFSFEEVRQYKFAQGLQDISRDLLTFEVGFETNCYDEEQFVFRGQFSEDEYEIEIFCNDIKVREIIV